MALKDLFTMVKADKYTADGREELMEARKAETEDRTYNIGEISEKTGLQKTAKGWRPVKKGGTTGAKAGPGKQQMTTEQRKKWEDKAANSSETKASLTNFINSMENSESFKMANPHADEIIEIYKKELKKRSDNPNYRPERIYSDEENKPSVPKKEIKTNGLTPAEKFNSKETAKTINAATNDYKQRDKMLTEKANKEFGTKGENPVEVAGELLINIRKAKPHSDEWYIAMNKYYKFSDTYRRTNGSDALDYYNSQYDKLIMTPNWNKEKLTDAAPHQLTGDTRLRLSQVTDKVYQIGEISPKTGLQKTANGWRPVKKNGNTQKGSNTSGHEAGNKPQNFNEKMSAIRKEEDNVSVKEADDFYKGHGFNKTGEKVNNVDGITVKEYKDAEGNTIYSRFNKEGRHYGSNFIFAGSENNSAPDLRTLPQHLEQETPQNTTITKEDEERFGKSALSGLSGPRESE